MSKINSWEKEFDNCESYRGDYIKKVFRQILRKEKKKVIKEFFEKILGCEIK